MSLKRIAALALLAPALVAGPALGQAPAANPLDAVPDKMPFDIPYGAPSPSTAPRRS